MCEDSQGDSCRFENGLQTSGLDIQRTGVALHELVLHISHISNMYVGVHGTTKTAREFLEGRKQQTPVTSSFGAVVLCELPDSVRDQRKTELPRFMVYGRCLFTSCIWVKSS